MLESMVVTETSVNSSCGESSWGGSVDYHYSDTFGSTHSDSYASYGSAHSGSPDYFNSGSYGSLGSGAVSWGGSGFYVTYSEDGNFMNLGTNYGGWRVIPLPASRSLGRHDMNTSCHFRLLTRLGAGTTGAQTGCPMRGWS